jgi:hypothetical protein
MTPAPPILVEYLGVSQTRGCLPPARTTDVYLPPPSSTLKHTQRLMTDAEKSEDGEKDSESPPLQIDPKWYAQPAFLARIPVH